jgi:hypothetical protein
MNKKLDPKVPTKPTEAEARKLRRAGVRHEKKFVRYLIDNQARNKPDCRRWVSFYRTEGSSGPSLVLYVFDLDIKPDTYVGNLSISTGMAALYTLGAGQIIDFTSMNADDRESWVESGILPKGFYG